MYLYNKNPEVVQTHAWVLDSATGNASDAAIRLELAGENIVSSVNCGNHFVCLTMSPKTTEFIVHDFTTEREMSTFRYKFDQEAWDKLVKTAHAKKNLQVSNIGLEGEGNFPLSACANKLYSRNDTLLLLMNNELKETNVYCFDLKNKNVTTRTISHFAGFPDNSSHSAADNSYLVQDKLLYVRVAKDSLGIQILNFNTGKEIAVFQAAKKDSLGFINSPIVTEPMLDGMRLPDVGGLFRDMVHDNPFITALLTNNNQLAITIGSSSSTVTTTRKYNLLPIPGAFGGALINTAILLNGKTTQKVIISSTHTSVLVDAGSGIHLPGETPMTHYKQIEKFSRDLNMPIWGEALFTINGGYNYVYYDKKERKIMVFLL